MVAQRIQGNYDHLQEMMKLFMRHADMTVALTFQIEGLVDQLQGGAWRGVGAEAFYAEMRNLILPAMRKLQDALQGAGEGTGKIHHILREAEEEAARLFRGEGIPFEGNTAVFLDSDKFLQVNSLNIPIHRLNHPLQQSTSSPYWTVWQTLPDWLRPWSTNPWLATQRFLLGIKLSAMQAGGSIVGKYVASALLSHYLGATGTPYFVDAREVLGNLDFMGRVTTLLAQSAPAFVSGILKNQINGLSTSRFPQMVVGPFTWSFQPRFGGQMHDALGTATVNPGGDAQIQYVLNPDPHHSGQGLMTITITQNMELYDRYDWKGSPIAYNSQTDTVAIPGNSNRPILILDKNGKIVDDFPTNTDLAGLGYTTVEYPPDSPDIGALDNLYTLYKQGTLPPGASTQVFGTFDHPYEFFAGDFHALEAMGHASAFDVYSQWTYQQTFVVPYTTDASGNVVVSDDPIPVGTPQYTPSPYTSGPVSGTYTPVNPPKPSAHPYH